MVDPVLKQAAGIMARQLQENKLSVVLVDAPVKKHMDHKVRMVENRNPDWYRKLCARHTKNRSVPRIRKFKFHDTKIVRGDVIKALERIKNGDDRGVYAERLLPFIQEWINQFERTE